MLSKAARTTDENKNVEKNTGAEGASPPSPPTESAETKETDFRGDTPNDPMDASPDQPAAEDMSMESPDKQAATAQNQCFSVRFDGCQKGQKEEQETKEDYLLLSI